MTKKSTKSVMDKHYSTTLTHAELIIIWWNLNGQVFYRKHVPEAQRLFDKVSKLLETNP